ncbi:MAG: glycosyltransferase family 39 protein [Candidatus Rokubacteria bacterium]|nr:glycosyltransferase family 39 protein [Candidatus Rokubacteria bacterium]
MLSARALHVAAALLFAAVFIPLGLTRLVDADEGIYLINARMTMEGQVPFFDYYYPQMFLLPYIYAAWMWVTGPSWYGGRLLSSVFTIALGLALVHHVLRTTRSHVAAGIGALLFASTSLAFANLPLVKTYAFATLALFVAYSLATWDSVRWRWLLCGALIGLAIDVRLYLAAAVPIFILAALRDGAPRRNVHELLGGLALALAPNLYFYLRGPDVFVFNILGTHGIRSPLGLVGGLAQKGEMLLNMIGINASVGATSFQFKLLLLGNLAWAIACLARRQRPSLAVQIAAVVLVASLLPSPAYGQYFAILTPFLVLGVVELGASAARDAAGHAAGLRRQLAGVAGVLVALYVAVAPIDVWWFTRGGTIVPGVFTRQAVVNWTIPTINAVGRAVDDLMPPGDRTAFSWWSGYFVETRARVHPLMTNPNTLYMAFGLAPEEVERYKFMTKAEMDRHIGMREAPVIVLGNWLTPESVPPYRRYILASGYVLARKLGDTEVYVAPARTSANP